MSAQGATPTLSVTITNYNYGRFLRRAIDSVLKQTFTDFELIIADNASTDDSMEVIQEYAHRDSRIRVITQTENKGLGNNLRVAAEAARGIYCVHVDADDWIVAPDAFARQIEMIESDPEISFVWSPVVHHYQSGEQTVTRYYEGDTVYRGEAAIEDVLKFKIWHTGPLFRLSAFRDFGGYDLTFKSCLDLRLFSELCAQGKVGYVNEPLYARYDHDSSVSVTLKSAVHCEEIIRAANKVFDSAFAARIPNVREMRRRILCEYYLTTSTLYLFGCQYRDAGKAFLAGAKIAPTNILLHRRTAYLFLRLVLGANLFERLQSLTRSGQHKHALDPQAPDNAVANSLS